MILRLIKVTPSAKETLGNILSSGWLWKSTTTGYMGKTNPDQALHSIFGKPLKLMGQRGRKNMQEGAECCKGQVIFNTQPHMTKIKNNKVLRSSLALPASLSKDSFNWKACCACFYACKTEKGQFCTGPNIPAQYNWNSSCLLFKSLCSYKIKTHLS